MTIDISKIHKYLNAIVEENINNTQLTELIKISRLIIQSYLLNYRSNVISLITRNGITLTDLAYDCIADAYSRNKELKYYAINKFINSLNENIKSIEPINLFFAYKSYLIKLSDSQVAKLYAQTDPIGAKILRNIKDAVRESDKLIISKDWNGLKIEVKNYVNENGHKDFPLEKLFLNFTKSVRIINSSDLLENVYDTLINQTEYKKSVYLFDLVSFFKKYFNANHDYNYEVDEGALISRIDHSSFEEYEIQFIRQKVEYFIKEKIMVNYFLKGKLNKSEAEAFFYSLTDLINDWSAGILLKSSIYEYLKNHYDISHDLYMKNYRTKMEYLVKLAREEFANYLVKEI